MPWRAFWTVSQSFSRRCQRLDHITMGYSDFSRRPYRFKSVSLRTNEEFVLLYNYCEMEEARLEFSKNLVVNFDGVGNLRLSGVRTADQYSLIQQWVIFRDLIWNVDELMKSAEKKASFSEVLAGIMPQIEHNIFAALATFHFHFGSRSRFLELSDAEPLMKDQKYLLQILLEVLAECLSSGHESAHKVVVSALALLSFVYQYLIGCVDKGGCKTYSPGSFLFRLIFVAIVLFLGSYVWIKFRQASYTASRRKRKVESDVPGGVYRRAVKDTSGSVTHYKYEPTLKPHREKLESGTSLEFNCLSLGSYDTPREAEIVRHIAAVLYGKEEGCFVQFEDELCLPFPSVPDRENCPPSGKEKAVWVTHKTKELYAELLKEKASRLQLLHPALETGSHHGHHDGEARRSDPSPSAPAARNTALELTCFTPPHGGNGVVEQLTTSEPHGLGQEASLAGGVFSAFYSDCDFDEGISSMPQWEENDLPAMEYLDKVVGDNSETDRVSDFESTLVPPQLSALDISTSAIFGSLPQLGVGDQGFEIIESHLNSATEITFQQLEFLPEQVQLQQRVTRQEQRPEEFSGSNVELQQKLLEYEGRISKLEVENEKWRSLFHRVTKLMSASNLDGSAVDLQ